MSMHVAAAPACWLAAVSLHSTGVCSVWRCCVLAPAVVYINTINTGLCQGVAAATSAMVCFSKGAALVEL
jgi:hypothetical protein